MDQAAWRHGGVVTADFERVRMLNTWKKYLGRTALPQGRQMKERTLHGSVVTR